MRLSDLQNKDIVSITDGKKIGKIIDVVLSNNGEMISLIIQKSKFNVFSSGSEFEVKWNQIKTIGQDVILINL